MSTEKKKYSWKEGEKILNNSDFRRLACSFLHADHAKVDYNAAAADFGAASANSFRVMLNQALKKVATATAEAEGNQDDVDNTRVTTPQKGSAKKRKAASDHAETPTRSQGAKKKKTVPTETTQDTADAEDDGKDESDDGEIKKEIDEV